MILNNKEGGEFLSWLPPLKIQEDKNSMSEIITRKFTLGTKEEMTVQRLELELSLLLGVKNKPDWMIDRINKKRRELAQAKRKLTITKMK